MTEAAKHDGGPAFAYGNHEQGGDAGMSLRDWFAGQYLAGNRWTGGTVSELAADAYRAADEMLEARTALAQARKQQP